MIDTEQILRSARCGACGRPIGQRLNLVEIDRRPTWKYPRSENLITRDGPRATAVCCDACAEGAATIHEVVELREGEIVYHALETLEQLPPRPTYAIRGEGSRQSITCLRCGMTSHHPGDVDHLYCANCKLFHKEAQ